jgi:GH25 family lysozyme M1 (1,4-beta-N-acetylmuramidase)
MTKEKKEIAFLIGGAAIAPIELIILIVLLIVNAGHKPTPASQVHTTSTAVISPRPEKPLPTAPTLPPYPLNDFSPEEFVMVDGRMTYTGGEYLLGIDVSSHQGYIDWKQVKDAGIQFVIIRLGYRGYGEEGRLVEDSWAQSYYKGAKEQGLLVGGYFFSQALCEEEAVEEARLALEIVSDWELDLPVAYDWEYLEVDGARTEFMERDQVTYCALAFCQTLEKAGVQPMIYTGVSHKTMEMGELENYPVWIAYWREPMTYRYWMNFWQYSATGSVPGITGDVDMHLYFPPEE